LGLANVEITLSEKSNSAYLATNMAFEDVMMNGKVYPIPWFQVQSNQFRYRPQVPRGFQEVKVPRLRDNGPRVVVRLSVLRTGRF